MSSTLQNLQYAVITQHTYIDDTINKTIDASYTSIESAMNEAINEHNRDDLVAIVSIDDSGNVETIFNKNQLLQKIEQLELSEAIAVREEAAGLEEVNRWYWSQR